MRIKVNGYQSTRIDACQWCGSLYEKRHPSMKYCSEDCKLEAQRERNRAYDRLKRERRRKFPLGTSNLRASRQKSFKREMELVEKEYGRVFGKRK